MNLKLLFPSILSADFSILREELFLIEKAGVDAIHVDVMDGHFVQNITFGPLIIETISKFSNLPIDVHLMIDNPEFAIKDYFLPNVRYISVHQETCKHLNGIVNLIKKKGIKAGVAINPATSLSQINWVLEDLDFVLIMGVNPGFSAQKFINNTISKVLELRKIIKNCDLSTLIQIDGGVNNENIFELSNAGVNIFVSGSAIFCNDKYVKIVKKLKSKM